MSKHVTSAPAQWIPDLEWAPFTVSGSPILLFDWRPLGNNYTALLFLATNEGSDPLTFTPEISPDGVHVCTVGEGIPAALTVPAGEALHDTFGIDLQAHLWRWWVSGTGSGNRGVRGIPR